MPVDKLQCRYCRLTAPQAEILYVKGKPIGECRPCHRNRNLANRIKLKAKLGFYQSVPELVSANLKVLSALGEGAYALHANYGERRQAGYLIHELGQVFVKVFHREGELFHADLFGLASYFGNLNVTIDPKPLTPPPIEPAAFGGLTPIDVQERLIWYDPALQAKAMKLLRDEAKAAKQANMAIARSLNPRQNAKAK